MDKANKANSETMFEVVKCTGCMGTGVQSFHYAQNPGFIVATNSEEVCPKCYNEILPGYRLVKKKGCLSTDNR